MDKAVIEKKLRGGGLKVENGPETSAFNCANMIIFEKTNNMTNESTNVSIKFNYP